LLGGSGVSVASVSVPGVDLGLGAGSRFVSLRIGLMSQFIISGESGLRVGGAGDEGRGEMGMRVGDSSVNIGWRPGDAF